jgi:hypothetical protein
MRHGRSAVVWLIDPDGVHVFTATMLFPLCHDFSKAFIATTDICEEPAPQVPNN